MKRIINEVRHRKELKDLRGQRRLHESIINEALDDGSRAALTNWPLRLYIGKRILFSQSELARVRDRIETILGQ